MSEPAAKRAKTEVPEATATAEEVSDVLLDFGGDTIPVGSQLLRLASPVFNRMLVSGMKEAQHSIIKVEVASKEEFKVFYDLLGPFSWSNDKISEANVDTLLAISDYYQVDIVKQGCEQFLLGLPPTGDRLLQAQKHGLNKQYQRCIVSIAKEGTKDDLLALQSYPDILLDVALKQQQQPQQSKALASMKREITACRKLVGQLPSGVGGDKVFLNGAPFKGFNAYEVLQKVENLL
ncbi:bath-36 [Symbiodinium sp. CCMP2456]|nr:bath-36 [Symbiodinium sp. CCMP2456]